MSTIKKGPRFTYVWGLRGPSPQIWHSDYDTGTPLITPVPLVGEDMNLTVFELAKKYPPPAGASPDTQEAGKKPAPAPSADQ